MAVLFALLVAQAYAADRAPWLNSPPGARPLVGVQVKLPSFTAADASRIRRTGFDFVRLGAWSDRMNQPAYRHALDEAISSAQKEQLPVLLTVRSLAPLAARDASPTTRATALADAGNNMADLVGRLAARYGSRLLAIELWNEPDLGKYWPTGDVEEAFARYMQAACKRLATRRPGVPVIGFAFSRAPLAGSVPERMLQPLSPVLHTCLDAISYHSYGMTPEQIRSAAHTIRQRYSLPVLITEDGATSAGWRGDDRQARRLSMLLGARDELAVPLLSLYEWADTPGGSSVAQQHYGLLRADRSAKPALGVVEKALREPKE